MIRITFDKPMDLDQILYASDRASADLRLGLYDAFVTDDSLAQEEYGFRYELFKTYFGQDIDEKGIHLIVREGFDPVFHFVNRSLDKESYIEIECHFSPIETVSKNRLFNDYMARFCEYAVSNVKDISRG